MLLRRLSSFAFGRRILGDEIRLYRVVLFEKQILINNQVLNDLKHRQGLDQDLPLEVLDQLLAGQASYSVDPHSIRTADPVGAGHPEGQRRVLFRPNPDEAIEEPIHGVRFDFKCLVVRLFVLLGIIPEDFQLDVHRIPLKKEHCKMVIAKLTINNER